MKNDNRLLLQFMLKTYSKKLKKLSLKNKKMMTFALNAKMLIWMSN